jgi:aryl-phospho-beta-D-glucosidase BglC (GH1 family)
LLRVQGARIVDGDGHAVRLRGVCVGGWLNMENFITGYAANETMMRAAVRQVLGDERAERFFERLLTAFFDEGDVSFLSSLGLNSVRIPINYRHLEDDARPFEVKEDGFRHLDRAVEMCARHGIYSVIDLHALPGSQNHHWHSDNPTHVAGLWTQRQFQDRVVNLWEAIADRYKDNAWVAGYNPMNEPADESRQVVGPLYSRLFEAIRAVDPHHILFVDGNTYSTEFDVFADPYENTVYTCHDYVAAGLGRGGPYPGYTDGVYFDRSAIEAKFLQRTEYCRQTGTPIWVGEFGPIYTGDTARDEGRYAILADQLEIFAEHEAGFAIWTYKDVGRQGLVHLTPGSPYELRFRDFILKKNRLAADHWGSDGVGVAEVTKPVQDLVAREFPGFDPYPWGRAQWVETLLNNILLAQPLVGEYAGLLAGLSDDELCALADSFAFSNCTVRERLAEALAKG